MRTLRVTAAQALQNPKEQLIVNPEKSEFEQIVSDNSREYYLFLDDFSPITKFWLYEDKTGWQDYIQALGFKKEREFKNEIAGGQMESYLVYKKPKGPPAGNGN